MLLCCAGMVERQGTADDRRVQRHRRKQQPGRGGFVSFPGQGVSVGLSVLWSIGDTYATVWIGQGAIE